MFNDHSQNITKKISADALKKVGYEFKSYSRVVWGNKNNSSNSIEVIPKKQEVFRSKKNSKKKKKIGNKENSELVPTAKWLSDCTRMINDAMFGVADSDSESEHLLHTKNQKR